MAASHRCSPMSSFLLCLSLICLLFTPLVRSTLTSTGFTVTYNSVYYYVSPYVAGNTSINASALSTAESVHGFYPVTVMDESTSISEIPAVVKNYTATDDVFQEAFLQGEHSPLSLLARDLSQAAENGNVPIFIPGATSGKATSPEGTTFNILDLESNIVPSGPYFLEESTGELHMVYRLYEDYAGAFTESLLQTSSGDFTFLSAQIPASASLTVGVPSRLYYAPNPSKPLAGVRIGIKDIYDLAGVKTSDGNRAFYSLYPAANATGPAVQSLIDAGAIIVGHQKASQFANGEEATADWVDYHSPFNPRGDGYQDPSSSSSGAGASIASYPWLDIALGSDTGGSIRGPSEVQGLFGNRPSHGLVSLDDVMPLAPELDTAGFITRDPYLWGTAQAVLYGTNYTSSYSSYPSKIYAYNYPTNASESPSSAVLVDFLSKLTTFLSANTSAINLTSLWSSTNPASAPSLTTLLNITYPILISKEQINLVRKPFYAGYAAVHDGRTPFVDPGPLVRWAFGDSYPASALTDAINNKTTFMNWFQSTVLPRNADSCSDAFFIYVGGDSDPDYINERNQYLGPPSVPYGFSSGRISVFSEVPDSVFPIGQAPFFSNVTNHEEYLPVTIDILVAKGCDGLIVKLAQDLAEAGILSVPETGGTIYGGDVLMKREAERTGKRMRYVL